MILKQIIVGLLETNCFILGDENTGNILVIDPGDDMEIILKAIESDGLKVRGIICTHGHPDHTGGVHALKKITGAPLYLNEEDSKLFGIRNDYNLKDGEEISLDSIKINIIHTPGHTPGSVCLLTGNYLFTGDTLFAGSVGRTDFPGGDSDKLINSIKEKISKLPPHLEIMPGHGEMSRLDCELENNPYLLELS